MRRVVRRRHERGQSLVEFTFLLPVMLLILVSLLEFGLAFNHRLTLAYATREGARTGSALANGGGTLGCGGSPNWASVDPAVIAAVQRILESPGSPIEMANVSSIRIYKAQSNLSGNPVAGEINTWNLDTTPPFSGPTVDGVALHFLPSANPPAWRACERTYVDPADSIGVELTYRYDLITPIGSLLRYMGGDYAASFAITDRTIMQVNPVQ